MNKLLIVTFFSFFFTSNIANGQNINITIEDFNFVVDKIKDNYPSYSEKANLTYYKLLNRVKKRIVDNSNPIQNFSQLAEPVLFFKDLHLILFSTKPIFFDSSVCEKKLKEILKMPSSNNTKSKNGYWKSDSDDCIVYLQESKSNNENLLQAVVMETTNKNLKLGSIKFYITKNKIGKFYVTNYINSVGNMFGIFSYFLSKDTLVTGLQYKWTKIANYHPDYLKQLIPKVDKVALEIIDTNFIAIKIPQSDLATKHIVDSLITANKSAIEKTPNLIIDIRNNTGGTWFVYKSLFPYIYTNPMVDGEQFRKCSEDFIENQRQIMEVNKKDSNLNLLSNSKKDLDSMIKYRGSYYYSEPDTIKFDSIKAYPKKVIILTNYRCISASEMFLKFCQQSEKVIIAGEKTWGAVDNIGLVPFDSPSGNIKLYIPRTMNFYNKIRSIDFVGIKPNIEIPSNETDWYKFIITYFANKK
jgi:hypothetical protein